MSKRMLDLNPKQQEIIERLLLMGIDPTQQEILERLLLLGIDTVESENETESDDSITEGRGLSHVKEHKQ